MPYPRPLFTVLAWLCLSFLTIHVAKAGTSKAVPGVIRVMRLVGSVSVQDNNTGDTLALNSGDVLSEHYTIKTGPYSSVVLLFSNGSTLVLKPETELSIAEFIQDPFKANTEYMSQLETEPSSSQTTLKLKYGSLIGQVKHLKTEEGSTYDVDTPIGIAGIRGTSFALTIDKDLGTLQVAEGEMFFLPSIGSREGEYIIAKTESQLRMSPQSIIASPLDPKDKASIIDEASQASEGLSTIPIIYFEPGPDNAPSIEASEKPTDDNSEAKKPPAPSPAPSPPAPPKSKIPGLATHELPNPDANSIDDTQLSPFASPPPASPVTGS
jgi:hypothetical protein